MKKAGFWRVGASVVACSIAAAAIAGTGHQWGNYLWDYTYNPNVQKQLKLDVYYKFSPSSGATTSRIRLPSMRNALASCSAAAARRWSRA